MSDRDLYRELVKSLPLPEPFLEVLQPPLRELGYGFELHDQVVDDVEGVTLKHYRLGLNGRSVALLHVMKDVIKDRGGVHFVNTLVEYFIKDIIALFVFTDTNDIGEAYDGRASKWLINNPDLQAVKFFRYEVIENLRNSEVGNRSAFLSNRLILPRLFPILSAPLATDEGYKLGPAFAPTLPANMVEYQSLFDSKPNFIDVGMVQGAMRYVSSVCLIKLYGQNAGTGFLVDKDLVLTNYHVMRSDTDTLEQMRENALKTTLHFGYVSSTKGEPIKEKVFTLDPVQPIVDESPKGDLDFALLRVVPSIKQAEGLTTVDFSDAPPTKLQALNMLQHPGGLEMQLALSGNAVTWVSPDDRLVEYLTPSAKGSSGSPCFNHEWKLVALHHSEETRRIAGLIGIGTIRQGIVFAKIYEQIKKHLSPPP